MAKWANDLVMDAALDKIATATQLLVCTAQPSDRATALSTAVATQALTGAFTKADGDVSGRKVTIAAQNGLSVSTNGTATYLIENCGTNRGLASDTQCSNMATQRLQHSKNTVYSGNITLRGPRRRLTLKPSDTIMVYMPGPQISYQTGDTQPLVSVRGITYTPNTQLLTLGYDPSLDDVMDEIMRQTRIRDQTTS